MCVSRMEDPQAVCSADRKEGRPGVGTAAEQTTATQGVELSAVARAELL